MVCRQRSPAPSAARKARLCIDRSYLTGRVLLPAQVNWTYCEIPEHHVEFESLTGSLEAVRHELRHGRGFVVAGARLRNTPAFARCLAISCRRQSLGTRSTRCAMKGCPSIGIWPPGSSNLEDQRCLFRPYTDSPSRLAGYTPDYTRTLSMSCRPPKREVNLWS